MTCDLTGEEKNCQTFEIDTCDVVMCQTLGNLTEICVDRVRVKLFNCSGSLNTPHQEQLLLIVVAAATAPPAPSPAASAPTNGSAQERASKRTTSKPGESKVQNTYIINHPGLQTKHVRLDTRHGERLAKQVKSMMRCSPKQLSPPLQPSLCETKD